VFFIIGAIIIGICTAMIYGYFVMKVDISVADSEQTPLTQASQLEAGHGRERANSNDRLKAISGAIAEGAQSFLKTEYIYISVFCVVFSLVIGWVLPSNGWATAFSFLWGSATSVLCGYIGMMTAVKANVRVCVCCVRSSAEGFLAAFQGGAVMGFALCSIGLANLLILIAIMNAWLPAEADGAKIVPAFVGRFEAVAGYGLGGSVVALFGRVGGGIFTKAADVGADLVGKVEKGLPEDDERNPAVIADNVGDNVGDIAGMGADLFGSFAEATCAALVIQCNIPVLSVANPMLFPLLVSGVGMAVCVLTSVIPMYMPIVEKKDEGTGKMSCLAAVELQLKIQLAVSTMLNTPVVYVVCKAFLPSGPITFTVGGTAGVPPVTTVFYYSDVFTCIACGLWSGLLIGFITEYYTSHSYRPVRDVAESCRTGAATNIIYGLALGMQSTIVPVLALAITVCISFKLASQYGVAMAALGMLSTLAIGLTIDGYGPISDNAGGIAEMCELGEHVRERTDALDAAGNTTAAIGKGFAIGSAALVSLALFSAYTVRAEIPPAKLSLLEPMVVSGLLVGAMLPYVFSGMTMKSVGLAAMTMVMEVRRQFANEKNKDAEGKGDIYHRITPPDYAACVKVATEGSLREMIAPAALVIFTPLLVGFCFGKYALSGLLIGGLVSGVQMAISSSNTGGAWDNAKKYIESGQMKKLIEGTNQPGQESLRKHSEKVPCPEHQAAVVGDTVGDPLKDTSGPSLNILVKLMAILSLVFADAVNQYGGKIFGIQ